ncbi:MAG: hypothetical protein ACR2K3_11035 [Nocardioides sp.]
MSASRPRSWTPSHWALRAVVALGPVVAMLALVPTGHPARGWVVLVVALLGVAYAAQPFGLLGTFTTGLVLVSWADESGSRLPVWAVAAAGCLVASHVAATLVDYGPDELPVAPSLIRRWAVRGALVFLAAPAVWLVALGLRTRPAPSDLWVAGLAVLVLGALVATRWFPTELDRTSEKP